MPRSQALGGVCDAARGNARQAGIEDAPELVTEPLSQQLEADRRRQQQDDPIDLQPPYEAPDIPVEVGEEERRKVPDRFLGADLPQAAPGKSATDGEGQRNPLPREHRGNAGHRADDGAGVGPGQETGEERAGERQIRRFVVQEQSREHAGCEWHAEAGREDEPFGPVALLGEEDAPKPRKPDEHRGEHGHEGELHHQSHEQELLGQKGLGFVRHHMSG